MDLGKPPESYMIDVTRGLGKEERDGGWVKERRNPPQVRKLAWTVFETWARLHMQSTKVYRACIMIVLGKEGQTLLCSG